MSRVLTKSPGAILMEQAYKYARQEREDKKSQSKPIAMFHKEDHSGPTNVNLNISIDSNTSVEQLKHIKEILKNF